MNSKFIASAVIAVASLTSVSAFAAGADGSVDAQTSTTSTLTRADVRASVATAQQGPVTASHLVDGGTVIAAPAATTRSRDEVRAEAVQSRSASRANNAAGRA